MFINIPGIYSLDANDMLPVMTIKNFSKFYQMFPRAQNCPQMKTTVLNTTLGEAEGL